MVLEIHAQGPKDLLAITSVPRKLGVGAESLRIWVKQPEIDPSSCQSRGWATRSEGSDWLGLSSCRPVGQPSVKTLDKPSGHS